MLASSLRAALDLVPAEAATAGAGSADVCHRSIAHCLDMYTWALHSLTMSAADERRVLVVVGPRVAVGDGADSAGFLQLRKALADRRVSLTWLDTLPAACTPPAASLDASLRALSAIRAPLTDVLTGPTRFPIADVMGAAGLAPAEPAAPPAPVAAAHVDVRLPSSGRLMLAVPGPVPALPTSASAAPADSCSCIGSVPAADVSPAWLAVTAAVPAVAGPGDRFPDEVQRVFDVGAVIVLRNVATTPPTLWLLMPVFNDTSCVLRRVADGCAPACMGTVSPLPSSPAAAPLEPEEWPWRDLARAIASSAPATAGLLRAAEARASPPPPTADFHEQQELLRRRHASLFDTASVGSAEFGSDFSLSDDEEGGLTDDSASDGDGELRDALASGRRRTSRPVAPSAPPAPELPALGLFQDLPHPVCQVLLKLRGHYEGVWCGGGCFSCVLYAVLLTFCCLLLTSLP